MYSTFRVLVDSYLISTLIFTMCYIGFSVVGLRLKDSVILTAIGWGAVLIVVASYALRLTAG